MTDGETIRWAKALEAERGAKLACGSWGRRYFKSMVLMEASNMTQTATIQPVDRFDGDFDVLPFAAHLRYGAIPHTVTSGDFQLAACVVSEDLDTYPEAHWYIEAMRERRMNPGRSLNAAKREINMRVSARLYARSKGWV